jgi:ABC-2 type transport system permease protein
MTRLEAGNMWAVCRKELQLFFFSPVAWILLFAFSLILGYYFFMFVYQVRDAVAVMPYLFNVFTVLILFATPFYTMRLLAEEKRSGTIDVLWSLPLTDLEIAAGKFLGSFLFYLILISITLAYSLFLLAVGRPDIGMLFANYLGVVLVGAVFISFGLLASSVSRNQIIAAMLTFLILMFFWLLDWIAGSFQGWGQQVLAFLSLTGHFASFSKGVLSLTDFVYLLSLVALNVFLTSRVLGTRR